ncbi:hypothetical protein PRIPAC_73589 [Pristionchus pacificus]|uniref:Protein kinase domain-containing protein n=1 Tax=Pristionchus pacificus TaxID=54126 RepID=A0A2A6CSM5_PRIPA|nr:hypothetical protein PRIPAC_73589 [Pristionchus pacificus]|eukprot:PDM81212.1 protein kinase [Pristionchus pacificus]
MNNHKRFHTLPVYDQRFHTNYSFTVPKRYSNLKFINGGSQGVVASADDSVDKRRVAIKKMHQPFVIPLSAKRAYREFVLLSSVKHPNVGNLFPVFIYLSNKIKTIIQTFSVFTPQDSKDTFQDVYLVMELMDHNLHEVTQHLALDHMKISFFIYQILCAVHHLHREGIIHRRMTGYVVTRYYRAPEVVLGLPYSEKVDVWSIGCIFAELINRRVLFPGRDKVDQWNKIVKVMGTPSEEYISQLIEPIANYVRAVPYFSAIPIEEIIPDSNFLQCTERADMHLTANDARRLISKMLAFDPNERYSVAEALQDPYVKRWFREDEVNGPLSSTRFNWDAAETDCSLAELNSLIFDEVKRIESTHDVFGGL